MKFMEKVNQAWISSTNWRMNRFSIRFSQNRFQSSNIELGQILLNGRYYYFNEAINTPRKGEWRESKGSIQSKTVDLQERHYKLRSNCFKENNKRSNDSA